MGWRIAKGVGIGLVALVLLVAAVVWGLDTQPGRRLVADRLGAYTTASGVTVRTSRIDGSLYGRMLLHDVEVSDPKGVFVTIPELTVDWRPLAYLHRRIEVREIAAPLVTVLRNPALTPTPTDPNAPTLPDIDLTVGRLALDRLDLRAPVAGQRHVVRLAGSAAIADGRARIAADAAALVGRGIAGGDTAHVRLDAVPDADHFALDARLSAPRGGLVDGYAHLGKPLALTVGGRGSWTAWDGRATALAGGAALADLALTARAGTFRAAGTLRPATVLTGPAARLTAPAIRLDARAALDHRTADVMLDARSDAAAVHAAGLVDFARSRFGDLKVEAALLRPGAIAPDLAGRDVALAATLDGPFATPTVDYRLSAAALRFGTTGAADVRVAGRGVVATDRITLPVHATVGAVTGLNPAVGGLVTHLRLDGDLVYRNGQVASDDLRLRSDRVDATAIVLADLGKGRYTGALKGRINDYLVPGLGRVDVVTDARLVPGRANGFAIRGTVRAATRAIINPSVANQLGGRAVASASFGYDLSGGATVDDLRLASPKLRILRGAGFYRPDGRIGARALGRSADYGPVELVAGGTLARPHARLRAASPGLGIGLAGLDATLTTDAAGYRVRATASSAYGPVAADVGIQLGAAGARFRIADASLAGLHLSGTVAQIPAGPFRGQLALAGAGLSGSARLSAAGAVQRADLHVSANAARLPGPYPVTIAGGALDATVLLPAAGPSAIGRFGFTGVRYGTTTLARAQGRLSYGAGAGQAQLVLAGDAAGAPFTLAGQARLSPARLLANLSGSLNGIAVRLAAPVVALRTGAGWQLQPATLLLPRGQVVVSGRYGTAPALHAVLSGLDLSILEPFKPGLGLGGTAAGTLDYAGGGIVPTLRARIDVAAFTRTAALTVSDPLDVALLATLDAGGGGLAALVKDRGTVIGRAQARLRPLGPGATLAQRLTAAPLAGGLRYNGPSELLWALTGLSGQQLSGPVAIGADVGGRLFHPSLSGVVRASALRYENDLYDTVLTGMAVDGRFTQSRFELTRLAARAGDGTVVASGYVGLDPAGGFPIDLTATLDRARLASGDSTNATASGTLHVTSGKGGGLIQGALTIPQARYQIVAQPAAAVPVLTGVRRKGEPPAAAVAPSPVPSNWRLDIDLRADQRLFVSGMGLEAEWRTRMHIGGTTALPQVTGRLEVVRGTFSFNGRRFTIDHGIVTFQGGLLDPTLDIAASADVEGVTVSINIAGTGQQPQITFSSTPTLPQDEILARVLFGGSVATLSPVQAIQLAAALNNLRPGSGKGLNPLGKLRSVAGIDRLRVLGADKASGQGTSLAAGKYISSRVYVEIITDARGFTATQLDISLSRALSLLSQAGTFGGSNVSLQYKKTY